jgi:hypothetical protein
MGIGVLAGLGSMSITAGNAFAFHGIPFGLCPFGLVTSLVPGVLVGTEGNGSRSLSSSIGGKVREKSEGLRTGGE